MSNFFEVAAKAAETASEVVKSEVGQGAMKFDPDKRVDGEKEKKVGLNENDFDPDKRIEVNPDHISHSIENALGDRVEKEKTRDTKDVLSDVELCTDPERRLSQALGGDGEWLGEPGKSEFIPNDPAARQAMKERGVESIQYDEHCEPDFSPVSEGTVEIDNMTGERYGSEGNFAQAYEKQAEQWNIEAKDGKTDWAASDVKTWTKMEKLIVHERLDMKTVDFVPEAIHKECKHYGGCAECNERDKLGGGFDV